MVVNRRKYGRIGIGEQSCVIRMNGIATEGFIINESIGGIRVGGVPLLHLFANQPFEIEYDDLVVAGLARTATRRDDGLFEIGLVRDGEAETSSSESTLVNSFWEVDGISVVCFPRNIIDEQKMSISFPDGKEFEVLIDEVEQMTREARGEYLLDAERRKKIGDVYSALYNNQTLFNDRKSILAHEYGPELS